MLPRKNRIERRQFNSLTGRGALFHSGALTLAVHRGEPGDEPRFAFSVSKKAVKKAVDRNKVRRRGYSAIKTILGSIKKGMIGHFTARSGSDKVPYSSFSDEVKALLSRSGAFKNDASGRDSGRL